MRVWGNDVVRCDGDGDGDGDDDDDDDNDVKNPDKKSISNSFRLGWISYCCSRPASC